jgi:hypothetical protein
MEAKVEVRAVKASGFDPHWEVTLSVWEDDRCVFSADLNDGHHGKVWHKTYAEEVARRINRAT